MKEETKINIYEIFWYLVIFSVIGLLVETLFGFATMGIVESRKGLLYGPFCPVYGVGAVILILCLSRYRNHPLKLFIYGFILGNVVEYLLSYFLESIYGNRFWDYSYLSFNLNGRVCVTYSIFWGFLSILLIKCFKPWIDKIIKMIPTKFIFAITLTSFLLLLVDALLTVWGVSSYTERAMNLYYGRENEPKNAIVEKIENTLFTDKIIQTAFPNLRFVDTNKKEIIIRDIIKI